MQPDLRKEHRSLGKPAHVLPVAGEQQGCNNTFSVDQYDSAGAEQRVSFGTPRQYHISVHLQQRLIALSISAFEKFCAELQLVSGSHECLRKL